MENLGKYYERKIEKIFSIVNTSTNKIDFKTVIFFEKLCEDDLIRFFISNYISSSSREEIKLKKYEDDFKVLLLKIIKDIFSFIDENDCLEYISQESLIYRIFLNNSKNLKDFTYKSLLEYSVSYLSQIKKYSEFYKLEKILNDNYLSSVILFNAEHKNIKFLSFFQRYSPEYSVIDNVISFLELEKKIVVLQEKREGFIFKERKEILDILTYIYRNYGMLEGLNEFFKSNLELITKNMRNIRPILTEELFQIDNLYTKLFLFKENILNNLNKKYLFEYYLFRYKTFIEKFEITRIIELVENNSGKVENALQMDIGRFLFNQGFDIITENEHNRDRFDIIVSNEHIVEVKIFSDENNFDDFIQGVRQINKYINSYKKEMGYYVIYQNSFDYKLSFPENISFENSQIKLISVDILNIGGRKDKRKIIVLTEKDIKNIINNSEVYPRKWNDISFSDLYLIDGFGMKKSIDIILNKEKISTLNEIEKIHGIGKTSLEALKQKIIFDK
jgi:hypothetical protein